MANTWADQLRVGDMVNVGDLGDALDDTTGALKDVAWVRVNSVHPCNDGFTDLTLDLSDGRRVHADLPSAERVTVRRN